MCYEDIILQNKEKPYKSDRQCEEEWNKTFPNAL